MVKRWYKKLATAILVVAIIILSILMYLKWTKPITIEFKSDGKVNATVINEINDKSFRMSDEDKQQLIELLAQSEFKRKAEQPMMSADKLVMVILSGEGINVKSNLIVYLITDKPNTSFVSIDDKTYSIDSEDAEKLVKLIEVLYL